MAASKASKRVSAARVKQILALKAAKTSVAAIARKFRMPWTTVRRIVSQGDDHCVVKNQAMLRAVKEAVRKLGMKPKARAPGRGKRVKEAKIIAAKEVCAYIKEHSSGLKVKVSWIPSQRKMEGLIATIPRTSRTRRTVKKPKVVNNGITEDQHRNLMSQGKGW